MYRDDDLIEELLGAMPTPSHTKKSKKDVVSYITGNATAMKPFRHSFRGELKGKPLDFIKSILPNHYRWEELNAKPISSYEIRLELGDKPNYNTLTVVYTDGTERPNISLNKCLDSQVVSARVTILNAMRGEVRARHGKGTSSMHLDHTGDFEFNRIATTYLEDETEESLDKMARATSLDGKLGMRRMNDNNWFIDYHDSFAELQFIPAHENLSKQRKIR